MNLHRDHVENIAIRFQSFQPVLTCQSACSASASFLRLFLESPEDTLRTRTEELYHHE